MSVPDEQHAELIAKLDGMAAEYDRLATLMADPKVVADPQRYRKYASASAAIEKTVQKYREYRELTRELQDTEELLKGDSEPEFVALAEEEKKNLSERLAQVVQDLREMVVPRDPRDDSNIIVEVFPVTHGSWPNAWGFRFTTPDKVIVISGDCMPSEKVVEYARGAHILVHEVYSQSGFESRDDKWQSYHGIHHTSTLQLAELADRAKPEKVVLYHILFWGATEAELLNEIRPFYPGEVIVGRDLDIF